MSDNNLPPTFEPSASREAALSRYSTLEKLRYAFTKLQLDASALLDTINRNAFVSFVDGDVKRHARQIFEEATASVYAVTAEQHFRMQESATLPPSTKGAGFTLLDDLLADIKDIHRYRGPLGMARYPKPPTSESAPIAGAERCDSTISIEDPVAVTPFRCENEATHAGPHRATYPGVEGNVRAPITWYGSGQKIEVHANGAIKAPRVSQSTLDDLRALEDRAKGQVSECEHGVPRSRYCPTCVREAEAVADLAAEDLKHADI